MASLKTAAFDEDVVMEPITFDVAINVSQDVGVGTSQLVECYYSWYF